MGRVWGGQGVGMVWGRQGVGWAGLWLLLWAELSRDLPPLWQPAPVVSCQQEKMPLILHAQTVFLRVLHFHI